MAMKLSLSATANAIATIGMENTLLLRGEPGVGKSSILVLLAKQFPDHHIGYIDCANLDLGDIAMPVIDRVKMVTNYAPNARFGVGVGFDRPVIIMLDEVGKASRAVLNMLLPVMNEKRIGDNYARRGSIVFGTTNLDTDGVGDNFPAQGCNRVTEVIVPKPTWKEWVTWGSDNGIDPVVLASAKQYPEFFDSYYELAPDTKNPYIFNPLTGNTRNFVSPRSLERASNIIKKRAQLGESVLPLLAGTVGEPAARMMEALVHLSDQLPDYESIVRNPSTTKLPDSPSALFLLSFMLAGRLTDADVLPVCQYAKRMGQVSFESTALYLHTVASNNSKIGFAAKEREFTKMMAEYGKYFPK